MSRRLACMHSPKLAVCLIALVAAVVGCTPLATPGAPAVAATEMTDPATRGAYLVRLMSCSSCHTDGSLMGAPDQRLYLAGSSIGIAWTTPIPVDGVPAPAVVFPPNLTSDRDTGIGRWTDEQLLTFLKTGVDGSGQQHVRVMPFPLFAALTPGDARAIVSFLRTLQPIAHRVPDPVPAGTVSKYPFVQYGVYSWHPGMKEYQRNQ